MRGSPLEDAGGNQNAFADAVAVLLKRAASNPLNAHEKPIIRPLLPNITANPFADLYSITAPPIECTTNPLLTGNARALQSRHSKRLLWRWRNVCALFPCNRLVIPKVRIKRAKPARMHSV
ncbi:hypothetical protein BKA82DRAFT_309082 [Pisolithus tinctorius]|uniref:Uncharacterized protein n=1 Tax=Pisolithus tinctorius Marx 270 TaxID=870435 RepID=A0A0C3KI20_PISTI|nr:hypothetical protein BKA82DRAFT_309082 [Pisolithus tinctorius]KIO09242.1 hypothetical protein M404DRAFT_309082 [Pisolithus tinctorius Marx 270]